jgi:deazaflavin-dependent oxidoreductase (nitroreductase family)
MVSFDQPVPYNTGMSPSFEQDATGSMTYPGKGTLNRFLFKAPLICWRMGLGPLLGRWMLLLTTWGRRSQLPRHTLLSYTLHEDRAYVISGWGQRTDWYRNLSADPRVGVQLSGNPYPARARRVVDVDEYAAVMGVLLQTGGDSHFKPWLRSLDIAYDLEDLVAKRDRVYLVAIDPSEQTGPPSMARDLLWVWGAVVGVAVLLWLLWSNVVINNPPSVRRDDAHHKPHLRVVAVRTITSGVVVGNLRGWDRG